MSLRDEELLFEGSIYIGIMIMTICYGTYLGIYYLSTFSLLTRANARLTRLQRIFYITYGSTLLILNTTDFVAQAHLCQDIWITDRPKIADYVLEYYDEQVATSAAMILANIAQDATILLANVFLIYRCYIVFNSRWYSILLPTLCIIGTFVMSIAEIPLAHTLEGVQWLLAGRINSAGVILATATNVISTVMISWRILSVLYRIRDFVSPQTKKAYSNIVVLLAESAAPSAILGIMTSVFQLLPPPFTLINSVVFPMWSSSAALFPQLIILRIAEGTAWTETTSVEMTTETSTVVFAPIRASNLLGHEREQFCDKDDVLSTSSTSV